MPDQQNITSRPWGNLASYTDAEWHDIYRTLFDGDDERGPLLNGADNFEVTASSPAGMTIEVGTGAALVYGLWCENTEARTLTVTANAGGAARYDLVFLHWTRLTQEVAIRIVDGTAATCALAVPPAVNAIGSYQDAVPPTTEWAVPLACITVNPLPDNTIVAGDITDLREFSRFRMSPESLPDGATLDTIAAPANPPAGATIHQMQIADGGVGVDQINVAIAGDGLTGGDGAALDVVPDGVTLEISGGNLRIINGEVRPAIWQDRMRQVYVGANEMQPASGGAGPTWGSLTGHLVPAEGWLFPQSADREVVMHIQFPADIVTPAATHWYWGLVWAHDWGGADKQVKVAGRYLMYEGCDEDASVDNSLPGGMTLDILAADQHLRQCTMSFVMNWNVQPGEYFDLYMRRGGTDAGDTLLDDWLLLGFILQYEADM